jgi:hypothetical protein
MRLQTACMCPNQVCEIFRFSRTKLEHSLDRHGVCYKATYTYDRLRYMLTRADHGMLAYTNCYRVELEKSYRERERDIVELTRLHTRRMARSGPAGMTDEDIIGCWKGPTGR